MCGGWWRRKFLQPFIILAALKELYNKCRFFSRTYKTVRSPCFKGQGINLQALTCYRIADAGLEPAYVGHEPTVEPLQHNLRHYLTYQLFPKLVYSLFSRRSYGTELPRAVCRHHTGFYPSPTVH